MVALSPPPTSCFGLAVDSRSIGLPLSQLTKSAPGGFVLGVPEGPSLPWESDGLGVAELDLSSLTFFLSSSSPPVTSTAVRMPPATSRTASAAISGISHFGRPYAWLSGPWLPVPWLPGPWEPPNWPPPAPYAVCP